MQVLASIAVKAQERYLAHGNTKKVHCKHGHAYTPENTLIRKDGRRVCRTCNKEWNRNNYLRRIETW